MNESNLSVSGVFLPAQVLQHPALNPAMVYNWVLLRVLVGRGPESTPVTIPELEAYTGKSPSSLYMHLSALRQAELVCWRLEARGRMVLSFPEGLLPAELEHSNNLESTLDIVPKNWNGGQPDAEDVLAAGVHSKKMEQGSASHSNKLECSENLDQKYGIHSRKLEYNPALSPENWNKDGQEGGKDPEIGVNSEKLDDNSTPIPKNWNDALSLKPLINNNNINKEVLREARFQKTGTDSKNLEREAVRAYRSVLGLRPNQSQRSAIGAQVQDLDLWQATLEHWGTHRWNPKNVPGILELYARDGPAGCRYCRRETVETGLDALASLRREYAGG